MVRELRVSKIMPDDVISDKEGEHFDESHYNIIINKDTDVYQKLPNGGRGKLLLKFRKKVIPKEFTDAALNSYRKASKAKHENRGASAGILDRNKMAKYIGKFVNEGKFRTKFISNHSNKLSKQLTSNLSPSNIIGFYDKADRNLKGKGAPCRLTAFNRDNPTLWNNSLPFIKKIDELFKELTPDAYKKQYDQCQKVPEFSIEDTAFSTLTINYSWRTALHKDQGDFMDGFGNLIVIEDDENPNKYNGAYTGFPQFGVAVDVRTGDFLAMDVHEWHSNTEFKPINKKYKKNNLSRDSLNDWDYNRLAIVCYLRNNMIRCKNLKTDAIQLLNIDKHNRLKEIERELDTCMPGFIQFLKQKGNTIFD